MRGDRLVHDEQAPLYEWLATRIGLVHSDDFRAVGRIVDGRIVAVFGYNNHTGSSCNVHLAVDYPWALNRRLLWAAFHAPMVEWGYKVLLATIASSNEESLRLARRLGFEPYVKVAEAHPDGALHLVGMRREDCKWLNLKVKNGQ